MQREEGYNFLMIDAYTVSVLVRIYDLSNLIHLLTFIIYCKILFNKLILV